LTKRGDAAYDHDVGKLGDIFYNVDSFLKRGATAKDMGESGEVVTFSAMT
jgi:hypothetical protein